MPFIHHPLSVLEIIALGIAGLIALFILIEILMNIKGLIRYIHASRM